MTLNILESLQAATLRGKDKISDLCVMLRMTWSRGWKREALTPWGITRAVIGICPKPP